MDYLQGFWELSLALWLGLSTIATLWFGYQAAFLYWNTPIEEVKKFRGRQRYVYWLGAVLVWGALATFVLTVLYGLGRLWLELMVG